MIGSVRNEFVPQRDWSRVRTREHTILVWCYACKGTGMQRLRELGIIPRIRIITCKRCKNLKRLWVRPESESHREGLKVSYGLWNHDGKWREKQGVSRR